LSEAWGGSHSRGHLAVRSSSAPFFAWAIAEFEHRSSGREKTFERVNGDLPLGGRILSDPYRPGESFTRRNDRVLYIAAQESPGQFELFERFLGRVVLTDPPRPR
jgi:hypothetical protein